MVTNGIDRLETARFLKGKGLGFIATPSGVTRNLESSMDVLHRTFGLKAIFAPEHGARGEVEAGGAVETYTDKRTGLCVYSIYGHTPEKQRPAPHMLEGIDLLLMDAQDIGCRYYTFISTMRYCMEACKDAGKGFVVFDRPSPLGGLAVEGNLPQPDFFSFVGIDAIPQRCGLTVGELARYFNAQVGCGLQVVEMKGWRRGLYGDQCGQHWVNPSPNMPGIDAALLYPGTCLFEGTNLSEGRGTTKPFEQFGAPWLKAEELADVLNQKNLPGLRFRPVYFKPSFSKHAGELCRGVQAHIVDRAALRPLEAGLVMLETVKDMGGKNFEWLPPYGSGKPFIDLLAGSDLLWQEGGFEAYRKVCSQDTADFVKQREAYLLY